MDIERKENAMNIDEIMTLIQAVSDSALTSFELEEGDTKLSLKREKEKTKIVAAAAPSMDSAVAAQLMQAAAGMAAQGASGAGQLMQAVPQEAGAAEDQAASSGAAADIGSDKVIVSPLVGTFYSSSSPDAESFVKVGDTVKKGQVLGIIEAMKLMNEIESEYDGVIEAILVNNEDVVEYGQPLFRIK